MLTDDQERRIKQKAQKDHLYALLLADRDWWARECARKDVADDFERVVSVAHPKHEERMQPISQPVGFVHFGR